MRVLFLDCFSGISGDMTVGALCDLGVKPSAFEWELAKLEIGDFHMHFERKKRQAIEGIKFGIHEGATHTHDQDEPEDLGHSHDHDHHAHTEGKHERHAEHEHDCGHDHGHAHKEHSHDCGHDHEHHDAQAHGDAHDHDHSKCSHDHHHGEEHTHSHQHGHGREHDAQSEHSHEGHHDHKHEAHSHAHHDAHAHEPHQHGPDCNHGHAHPENHGHAHADTEKQAHIHGRSHAEIKALIEQSDLSDFVKKHALSIFQRIAVAEGRIHGQPPEAVTFHEVGALDSIADIICTCVGIEQLGVERVLVSPLFDGRGFVKCAHGEYPIPSTATLEILKGIPLRQVDEPYEFITPTGAAIVAEFGASFGVMPQIRAEKIGYGVGTRNLPNRPNVLRAVLGETEDGGQVPYETDQIVCVEANLDDQSPEITGSVTGKLLAAGALDVFLTPIQMKKNRPGIKLSVLCEEADLRTIADLLFKETTSFGIRMTRADRWKLSRKFKMVHTAYGEISVKLGYVGEKVVQVAPEFESCQAASNRSGQPLRAVYEAALQSYHAGNA